MEENLEVFFCDICNTSVPARDLELATAVRVNGRTIGGCCLPALQKPDTPRISGGWGMAIPLVLLAAVAGATVFLDWRLTEETTILDSGVERLELFLEDQHQKLLGIEERLDSTALREDVGSLRDDLDKSQRDALAKMSDGLITALDDYQTTLSGLEREVARLRDSREDGHSVITRMEGELRSLTQIVAELKAVPRALPAARGGVANPSAAGPVESSAVLPAGLQHLFGNLTAEDPGTRFEAVDELLRSKNPLVREHLLPMAKDPDMFVRRLTVEGLREFHHSSCVDTLLVALADPEPIVRDTAYDSVKELTGQNIPFDADAPRDSRLAAQRRWQDWWDENRESF